MQLYELRRRYLATTLDYKLPAIDRLKTTPLEILELGNLTTIGCYLGYRREMVSKILIASKMTLSDLCKLAKTRLELSRSL